MNVTEANLFHAMLRGLETDAAEDTELAGMNAASTLARRARETLGAGPTPRQAGDLVRQVQVAVAVAAYDEDAPQQVELSARPISIARTAGDLL